MDALKWILNQRCEVGMAVLAVGEVHARLTLHCFGDFFASQDRQESPIFFSRPDKDGILINFTNSLSIAVIKKRERLWIFTKIF